MDRYRSWPPPAAVHVLDMDSSASLTHGEHEGTACNGDFARTRYHPLLVSNQFGDTERCAPRPGRVHSASGERRSKRRP